MRRELFAVSKRQIKELKNDEAAIDVVGDLGTAAEAYWDAGSLILNMPIDDEPAEAPAPIDVNDLDEVRAAGRKLVIQLSPVGFLNQRYDCPAHKNGKLAKFLADYMLGYGVDWIDRHAADTIAEAMLQTMQTLLQTGNKASGGEPDKAKRIERAGEAIHRHPWKFTQYWPATREPAEAGSVDVISIDAEGVRASSEPLADSTPLARDTDGTLKPSDEVSYKPAAGWGVVKGGTIRREFRFTPEALEAVTPFGVMMNVVTMDVDWWTLQMKDGAYQLTHFVKTPAPKPQPAYGAGHALGLINELRHYLSKPDLENQRAAITEALNAYQKDFEEAVGELPSHWMEAEAPKPPAA